VYTCTMFVFFQCSQRKFFIKTEQFYVKISANRQVIKTIGNKVNKYFYLSKCVCVCVYARKTPENWFWMNSIQLCGEFEITDD
jgi:hypothetical protein